jgi:ABC-type dipeptide/oligopeptide/nickel transport system permease component
LKFIVVRLLSLVPVLFVIMTLVFLMTFLIPGDAATYMAGVSASPQQVEDLRRQLGLSDPPLVQYGRFLWGVLHGDLGRSLYTNQPVMTVVLERFPYSLILAFSSIAVSILIGIPVGVISAIKRGSWIDHSFTVVLLFGYSMPGFWLALMIILLFSLTLGWLPPTGAGGVQHLILPTVALAASTTASVARMARSDFLNVLSQDYIRTARGKGLSRSVVILRHALKNALIPVITVSGLQFAALIGRSVVIESVFAWPGIGRLFLDSIQTRDIPLLEGIVLVYAVSVVIINVIVDVSYAWLDPRVKLT